VADQAWIHDDVVAVLVPSTDVSLQPAINAANAFGSGV